MLITFSIIEWDTAVAEWDTDGEDVDPTPVDDLPTAVTLEVDDDLDVFEEGDFILLEQFVRFATRYSWHKIV